MRTRYFSILFELHLTHNIILISGVQHSDRTFVYIMK